MIKKIIIIFGILSIVFLPPLVITHLWVLNGKFILGHDVGYRLHTEDFFNSLFYLWSDTSNFGGAKYVNPGAIPIHTIEFIISAFTQNLFLRQYLVIMFWQVLLFSPFVAIYLFYYYKKNPKTFPFFIFATFLYAVNFFNLQGWGVFWRTRFSIQIMLPLFFAVFYKTLIDKKINYLFLLVLIIATTILNGGGSPPLYAPTVLVWLVTFVYLLIVEREKIKLILVFFKFSTLYLVGFCLTSAFWLYPYGSSVIKSYNEYIADAGGISRAADWLQVVAAESSFVNIFRLQGFPSWYDNPFHPYAFLYRNNEILILASFVLPILALSAYLLTKNNYQKRIVLLFYLFILVGIFFTAGSHPPLGELYKLFFKYVPGFVIFRTSFYKFGALIWFSFSVLSAFTLYQIGLFLWQKTKSRAIYTSYILVIVIFILAYHFPYFSSRFFKWDRDFSTLVSLPQYVLDYKDWSNKNLQNVKGRVLLLPLQEKSFNADSYTWGYWSLDTLPSMVSSLSYVGNQSGDEVVDNMVAELEQAIIVGDQEKMKHFSKLLDIEYFLLRGDVYYNYQGRETFKPKDFINAMGRNQLVADVASFGRWRLYRIKSYSPSRFYLGNFLTLFYGKKANINRELDFAENAFISAGDPNNVQHENLFQIDKKVILPDLIDNTGFGYQAEKFKPRIYPDSFLYPFVEFKREKEKSRITDKRQLIDYHLGNGAKYLHELEYLEKKIAPTSAIEEETQKILSGLSEIDTLLSSDKDGVVTTKERLRAFGYLNKYEKEAVALPTSFIDRNLQVIKKIRSVKQRLYNTYSEEIDCILECQLYMVDFPEGGKYQLFVHSSSLRFIESIVINGNVVYDSGTSLLGQVDGSAGSGEVELKNWQYLTGLDQKRQTITMKVNRKGKTLVDNIVLGNETYDVEPNISGQTAIIVFDYQIEDGDEYVVNIRNKNTISNSTWDDSKTIYGKGSYTNEISMNNPGDSIERITITPLKLNSGRFGSEINNMHVIFQPELDIAFVKEENENLGLLPDLGYVKKNPSQWEVRGSTKNSQYLVFSESFDDWQLDRGELPHFRVNGNLNGWIIDKQKPLINTKAIFPSQKNISIGFLISFLSLLGGVTILLFATLRKKIS